MSGRSISGTYTAGVALTNADDNPVTILSSASIANAAGVALQAAPPTDWAIDSAGTISGYSVGVSLAGSGTLTNTGSIGASRTTGAPGYTYDPASHIFTPLSGGVLLGGGRVSNAGLIAGYFEGVALGGAGSLVNTGAIQSGTAGFGVVLTSGGAASNASGGTISGGRYGVAGFGSTQATLTNDGAIFAQRAIGVALFAGGTIANGASAVIRGASRGLAMTGAASTLTNQGIISGGTVEGALLAAGGYASNAATGTITGAYFGLRITNVAGSVNNLGSISSSRTFTGSGGFDAAGVQLSAGGTLSNGVSGNIRATWKGVEIGNVNSTIGGTVFNQGTIFASNPAGNTGAAVWIHGPGLISNASTGTIAGGPFGIVTYFQTTIVNHGSIGGSAFAIDALGGFAIRVIAGPGARFTGTVTGGNSIGSSIVSALEFASGAATGTISGLGSQFIDFADISIDAGAVWTASGANTLASGVTLSNRGTLLLNAGTISGAGSATISGPSAYAAVSGAGALWTGAAAMVVGGDGSGTLLIDNHGTVQTAVDGQGVALADAAGGIGRVVVSGDGSRLGSSGRFVVGNAGFGKLAIQNGGTVITTPGASGAVSGAVIAAQAGADGSVVEVTGAGSGWDVTGTLVVGQAAFGSLAITAGGTVTADALTQGAGDGGAGDGGAGDGGAGIVSVVGAGSRLALDGSLVVGLAVSAGLAILNGATVSAARANIGGGAGGTGNVDIEGAGSHLQIASDLDIGVAGVGVLTLGGGTELTVASNLNIGATGVLNQFGGIIDPEVVSNQGRIGGSGAIEATVSFVNDGTLYAIGGSETVTTPLLTGSGVLEIDAGGTLVLNAGSVAATQTVIFADATGVLSIGRLSGFAATIGRFQAGDAIEVQDASVAATSFDPVAHVLTLFDASHAVTGALRFGETVTDGAAIRVNGVAPCFAAGTRIATERGPVAVEDLRVGGPRVGAAAAGGAGHVDRPSPGGLRAPSGATACVAGAGGGARLRCGPAGAGPVPVARPRAVCG